MEGENANDLPRPESTSAIRSSVSQFSAHPKLRKARFLLLFPQALARFFPEKESALPIFACVKG
jgi:hypothetical protein